MLTEEVFVQQFAKLFVHYREALKDNHDSTPDARLMEWYEIPSGERDRMVAAARLALLEIEDATAGQSNRSRYFAKPGEAEWGC